MIDTNPIGDKNLAQKDEDLIKNIADEMNANDKKSNKSQSEIEEQIEQGYIKLKSDINKVLTPIVQAMIELGVDSGLVAAVESEIYSDARKTFFNRVINSDINNMEEISKNVQKESLKQLTPLFQDGEVSQDVSQLKQVPPMEYNHVLSEMINEKVDEKNNKEEEADSVILADNEIWLLTRDNAYKKAFGEDAKEEDKEEMMALYTLGLLRNKIVQGSLKENEREIVISAINDLMKFGDKYKIDICIAIEKLGISEQELSENAIKLLNDFNNPEDAIVEEEIADLVAKIEEASNGSPEEQMQVIEGLKEEFYGIDAITRFISERTNYSEPLNDYQKDIVQAGIDILKDPNAQMEIDGFVYIRMLDVLKDTYEADPKLYNELMQAFNGRMPENCPKVTDALMKAVMSDSEFIIDMWEGDNSIYYGEDGCKNAAEKIMEITKGKFISRDDERLVEDLKYGLAYDGQNIGKEAAYVRFEAIKNNYSPEVVAEIQRFLDSNEYKTMDISIMQERRENKDATDKNYVQGYLSNMTRMMRDQGTKEVKEYIESLLEHSSNKEEVIDATLKFFEQEKENEDTFKEKENVELRKDAYVSILVLGIDNPEIYERMRQIDRDTAKIVVNETLKEINDSRNFYNGLYESVQKLGKGLNEKIEESVKDVVFDAKKTTLPKVDLLPNDKENEGWEPGD